MNITNAGSQITCTPYIQRNKALTLQQRSLNCNEYLIMKLSILMGQIDKEPVIIKKIIVR